MTLLDFMVSVLIGYTFGCFQTAYIVGRLAGKIDIREHGSNNAGASNVTTVMGWKFGFLTAILDILKAIVAVLLVARIFPGNQDLVFVTGAGVIIGHVFPVFLKFRGGKGMASLIGMFLVIDFKIGVLMMASIAIITLVTNYISFGTLTVFSVVPCFTFFSHYQLP